MRITDELKPHHKYAVYESSYFSDGVFGSNVWSYHTTIEAAECMCDEMNFRSSGESWFYLEEIDWDYEKEMAGCKSKKELCAYYGTEETSKTT